MDRRQFIGSGAAVIGFQRASRASPLLDDFGAKMHKYLVDNDLLDRTLDNIVLASMSMLLSSLPWSTANVNSTYVPNGINIYVVKASFGTENLAPARFMKEIVFSCRDNFLALPPNTIMVDKITLAKVLYAAFEYLGALGYMEKISIFSSEGGGPWTQRQTVSISESFQPFIARRLMRIYGQLLSDKASFDILASKLATDFEEQKSDPTRLKATTTVYSAVLAPIIFHETAHLLKRDLSGFLDSITTFVTKLFGPTVRQREDAADKYSAEILSAHSSKLPASDKYAFGIGIRAFITYLTARVWFLVFDNFRGMPARNYFWQFNYVPCNQWDEWLLNLREQWKTIAIKRHGDPNDPVATAAMTINPFSVFNLENPLLLRSAEAIGLPVVTSAEFKGLVAKTQESMGDGSHAPHFLRAFRFSEVAASLFSAFFTDKDRNIYGATPEEYKAKWLGQELALIDAVDANNPKLMPPEVSDSLRPITASQDRIQNAFIDIFKFEEGVNCTRGNGYLGTLKSGRQGFIELVITEIGLVRIRVAVRYGQPGDESLFGGNGLRNEKKYKEFVPHLYLIGELAGADIDATPDQQDTILATLQSAVVSLRDQQTGCLFASYYGVVGSSTIQVDTKEDGWVILVAYAT